MEFGQSGTKMDSGLSLFCKEQKRWSLDRVVRKRTKGVEVSYDNNKENGVWTEWYENGQSGLNVGFEGSLMEYGQSGKDGQKKGTKQYSKGKSASSWRAWESDGN